MNQTDLFNIFTGSDPCHPVYAKPFDYYGNVYATDAHSIIRCHKDFIDFELSNPFTPPNCDAVFPVLDSPRNVITSIEDFEIFKTFDELLNEDEYIDCDECGGSGRVEWEYKTFAEKHYCPVCEGLGLSCKAKLMPTGNKIFPTEGCYATIDGVFFNINILYKVFKAQKIIGGEIISLNIVQKGKPAAFRIGNYDVLIMPIANHDTDLSKLELKFKTT